MTELKPDKFGQKYNADDDLSKWSNVSPADVRKLHARADVDLGPRSLHHTLGTSRNQASPGDHTHDGVTSKQIIKDGKVSVTFALASQHVRPIVFKTPYPAGIVPVVTININSGAGITARWHGRAYSITNTGFQLFLFKGVTTDADQAWTNIEVQWRATTSLEQ